MATPTTGNNTNNNSADAMATLYERNRADIPPVLCEFFNGRIPFRKCFLYSEYPGYDSTPRPDWIVERASKPKLTGVPFLAHVFNVRIPAISSFYMHTLHKIMPRQHLLFCFPVLTLNEGYYKRVQGDTAMRILIGGPEPGYLQVFVSNPEFIDASLVAWQHQHLSGNQGDMLKGYRRVQLSEYMAFMSKAMIHRRQVPWMGIGTEPDQVETCSMEMSMTFPEFVLHSIGNTVDRQRRAKHMRRIIAGMLLAQYRLLHPTRRMQKMREMALLLCMGLHPRLGERCPYRVLSKDVFENYVMPDVARRLLVCD